MSRGFAQLDRRARALHRRQDVERRITVILDHLHDGRTWTDRHYREHRVAWMDPGYCRNLLAWLRKRANGLWWAAMLRMPDYPGAEREEWRMDRLGPEAWLEEQPLVVALRRRVEPPPPPPPPLDPRVMAGLVDLFTHVGRGPQ